MVTQALTATQYRALCTRKTCRWCGCVLPETVHSYPHDGGYPVAGYAQRMWLYVQCLGCRFDWALWKLGAPSPADLAA